MDFREVYEEISKIKRGMPNVFDIVMAMSRTEVKLNEICNQISNLDSIVEEVKKIEFNHKLLKKFYDDENDISWLAIVIIKMIKTKQKDFAETLFGLLKRKEEFYHQFVIKMLQDNSQDFSDILYNLIKQNEDLYCDFVGRIFSERQKQIENYVWSVVEEKMSKTVGKKVLGAWATIILIIITLVLLGIGVVTTSSSLSELSDKIKQVSEEQPKK